MNHLFLDVFPWVMLVLIGFTLYQQFSKKGYNALAREQAQTQRELVTEARQMVALLKRVVDEQSTRIAALEAKYEAISRSGPPS